MSSTVSHYSYFLNNFILNNILNIKVVALDLDLVTNMIGFISQVLLTQFVRAFKYHGKLVVQLFNSVLTNWF